MPGSGGIKIVYVNSNGKPTRIGRLRNYIEENANASTIFIFNDVRSQDPQDIHIEGFSTILANNPNNNHYAGGAAILFNKSWTSLEYDHDCEEGIILKLDINNSTPIVIATLYLHPGNLFPSSFMKKIDETAKTAPLLLIGDFNSAAVEFGSRLSSKEGDHLVDLISTTSLAYIENETPTYICKATGSWNVLDLGFVNDNFASKISNFRVENEDVSDHFPLIIDVNVASRNPTETVEIIEWDAFEEYCGGSTIFDEALGRLEEEERRLSEGGEIRIEYLEELASTITGEITNARNKSTKIRERKRGGGKFPIAVDTKDVIRRKRNLNKIYLANKGLTDVNDIKERLKDLNREMGTLLRRDKVEFHNQRIRNIEGERNTAKRWKLINKELGNNKKQDNSPLNHLTKPDGTTTTNINDILDTHINRLAETHRPKEADEKMNDWNKRITEEIEENNSNFHPLNNLIGENGDDRIRRNFTKESLKEEIKKLKKKSAPGEDKISNRLLQSIPDKVVEILFKLFTLLIATGHFPRVWKRARIKMLLKPGRERKLSKNYRPISLLSAVGKLFEKQIKNSLDEECNLLNVIPEAHSGFRKGRGAQENFLRLGEAIAETMKTNKVIVAAFIDLERAFDALHHDSIRVKMQRLAIPPKLIRILSSFLRDRKIYVAEGSFSSSELEMEGGCPQGAIGSPPIFGVFDGDIPAVNTADRVEGATIYADDHNVWSIGDNVYEATTLIQRRLTKIEDWARKWRMTPAPGKSFLVCFSRRGAIRIEAKKFKISMMGKQIPWATEAKFLGATFDEKLNFEPHIDSLIKRNKPKVLAIRKLTLFNSITDTDLIIKLVDSLIFSTFDYSSPAYFGMSLKNWKKIDSFFSRSLKIIFGVPHYASNLTVMNFYLGKRASDMIKDRCIKRIKNIITNTPIVADILPHIAILDINSNYFGPIGNVIRMCGFSAGSCVYCFVGVYHCCVKRC